MTELKKFLVGTTIAAPLLFGATITETSLSRVFAATATSDQAQALLNDTCANCWADASHQVRANATLDDVGWSCAAQPCPGGGPPASAIAGSNGVSSITGAWGDGIYDSTDNQIVVWGGGHNNYYGNEVYAFSLRTLQWSRLTVPSSIAGYTEGPVYPDGKPTSSHSYDGLAYLPDVNLMMVAGVNDKHGNSFGNSFLFDLVKNKWQQTASTGALANVGNVAIYNPADRNVYTINSGHALQRYDVSKNTWNPVGNSGLGDYHQTGALEGSAGWIVTVGCCSGDAPSLYAVELRMGIVSRPLSKGDQTCQRSNAPGFVWDPRVSRFICWTGGKRLWSLDPATWEWTALTISNRNAIAPPNPPGTGQFGKFQYLSGYGALIAITQSSDHAHLFKCDGVQC